MRFTRIELFRWIFLGGFGFFDFFSPFSAHFRRMKRVSPRSNCLYFQWRNNNKTNNNNSVRRCCCTTMTTTTTTTTTTITHIITVLIHDASKVPEETEWSDNQHSNRAYFHSITKIASFEFVRSSSSFATSLQG